MFKSISYLILMRLSDFDVCSMEITAHPKDLNLGSPPWNLFLRHRFRWKIRMRSMSQGGDGATKSAHTTCAQKIQFSNKEPSKHEKSLTVFMARVSSQDGSRNRAVQGVEILEGASKTKKSLGKTQKNQKKPKNIK